MFDSFERCAGVGIIILSLGVLVFFTGMGSELFTDSLKGAGEFYYKVKSTNNKYSCKDVLFPGAMTSHRDVECTHSDQTLTPAGRDVLCRCR